MKSSGAQCASWLAPLVLTGFVTGSYSASDEPPCLYAVVVGSSKTLVSPCPESDPLGIARDTRVVSVMKALDIEPSTVKFRGCPKAYFSAVEAEAGGQRPHFVVTYPSEIGQRYLAPVVHELAHVMQMTRAAGLERLRATLSSIQIELGADFMVGYIFARNLTGTDREEFQHNLSLVGAYVEKWEDAHGTPEQRTAAFRRGVVNLYPYPELNYARASDYFIRNDFSIITQK